MHDILSTTICIIEKILLIFFFCFVSFLFNRYMPQQLHAQLHAHFLGYKLITFDNTSLFILCHYVYLRVFFLRMFLLCQAADRIYQLVGEKMNTLYFHNISSFTSICILLPSTLCKFVLQATCFSLKVFRLTSYKNIISPL